MSDQHDSVKQSVSSLLDNEHSELDLKRVLKHAEHDHTVLESWASYSLHQQVLKKEVTHICDAGFLTSVQQAIADEDSLAVTDKTRAQQPSSAWRSLVFKGGLAACFACAFLVGMNQWSASPGQAVQPRAVVADAPSGFELAPLNARTVSSDARVSNNPSVDAFYRQNLNRMKPQESVNLSLSPETQLYLNRLMLRHAEATSQSSSFGMIPLSRVSRVDESVSP